MESTEYDFGKLMWDFSMMTILTAYFLEINPLDQPAVEEGKGLAKERLSSKK
jgi:glucose-6-phosphate isomerase